MFYIVDKLGRKVGSADGPVDAKDLAARGEVVVASELNLPIQRVDVTGDPSKAVLVAKQDASVRKIILQTSATAPGFLRHDNGTREKLTGGCNHGAIFILTASTGTLST